MNDHEAQRIAAAIHELRPDWPASSLLTIIRKHLLDKPRRDVAVAFAWIACEAGTSTPARILAAGPWWRAVAVEGGPRRPAYDQHTTCAACGLAEPECRRQWPDDHEFESVLAANVRKARQQLDTARAAEALKDLAHTAPAPRPERPRSTKGTERVTPIREAMSVRAAALDHEPDEPA